MKIIDLEVIEKKVHITAEFYLKCISQMFHLYREKTYNTCLSIKENVAYLYNNWE